MEFFKKQTNIDFMGISKITTFISILLIVASIITLSIKGLNFGLDFTGGTQIELRYPHAADLSQVRTILAKNGYVDAKVQSFGQTTDILIRLQTKHHDNEKKVADDLVQVLKANEAKLEVLSVEFVGSEVGEKLVEQGGMAILVSLLATMLYIALRFEYRFAISSVVALIHDPIFILGLFSFFQVEFDLPTLAALLAIIGYSLNDTIVVFDRVRENFRHIRKGSAIDVVNISINQTLSRTIMTSGLTLLVVVALLLYGGSSLFGFSLALFVGIIVGTYSSIYIAGTLAIKLGLSRKDLLTTPKTEIEDRP